MIKKSEHTPAHLFRNKTPYFITSAIFQKRRLLTDDRKERLLEVFHYYFEKFNWELQHWVILDNHYHLLCMSDDGSDLTKIMRPIHGLLGKEIFLETNCEKPVWWNYWDYCPRSEKDYYARLNYLLYNPIKHGYVTDLKDYEFSSFKKLFEDEGREKLTSQFKKYPEYQTLDLSETLDDEF